MVFVMSTIPSIDDEPSSDSVLINYGERYMKKEMERGEQEVY